MKIFKTLAVSFAIAYLPTSAIFADDGSVSSGGGLPPSAFERDRTAIVTILTDYNVRTILEKANEQGYGILSITPKAGARDLWVIATKGCELEVQFKAKCEGPFCDFSATPLNACE